MKKKHAFKKLKKHKKEKQFNQDIKEKYKQTKNMLVAYLSETPNTVFAMKSIKRI